MKKYLAEFFGTFLLVLLGTATAVFTGGDPLTTAFVFGMSVWISANSLIGATSGAHLNPAVTIAFWVTKKIDSKDALSYIVAQFLGGIAGSAVLALLVSGTNTSGFGANGYGALSPLDSTLMVALLAELIVTAVFTFVILSVADKPSAGYVIPLTLIALILVTFNLTGASLNPARSLGPALFTGGEALSQVWVFLVAPSLGGVLGGWLYKAFKD